MERFSKDGKLIIPLGQRKKGTKEADEEKVRYVVTEAYCPNGCNIIDADMVIIGLTPKLDFNNAISFCNVTGCTNGTSIKSGDVIRHVRLWGVI